ncbi:type II secretion system protein N [uncultured Deefgea sp.]|uniref:type II secretion system protein N n=1 Tax=uncultured Deefgea sp. TaxID=1304914 RepID=UPI002614CC6B|nr:type II secretion system protein N [uncultured Deefgea sp.]
MHFPIKHSALFVQCLLGALFIWLFVGLVWQWLEPQSRTASLRLAAAAPKTQAFNPDAVAKLFATGAGQPAHEATQLSLRALVSGAQGIAIIDGLEASAVAVKVGDQVGAYGQLIAAQHDHIVLEQHGTQKKIFLPAASMPLSQSAAPQVAHATAPQATPSKNEAAVNLTRGQLTGMLQGGNLANWSKGLGTSAAGGIVVEQANQQQLAQVLQLRDGDILKTINGRPLNKLDDLSLLYGAFSQQNQLSLQIQRQDQSQTISYTVNP